MAPTSHELEPPRNLERLSMAFDAARGQIVLFGGYLEPNSLDAYGDTWTWDGTNWTLRSTADAPPARGSGGMAYDAANRRGVLFGGLDDTPFGEDYFCDTWGLDGSDWTP